MSKVPDEHPGWDRLVAAIVRVDRRHPVGHDCRICAQVRRSQFDVPDEADAGPFWRSKVA